jgi:hypothetical protein
MVGIVTRPLVRSQRTIESRLRMLGQKLNDELGFRDQRLRFTKRAMRAGPTVWALRNEQVETAAIVLPAGVVAELASATNDDAILYFGYNEEWQAVQAREQIEFVSSNLRFLIAGVEQTPDLRFRLEWAGARGNGDTITYPGSGAAHPHWQFDVDVGWIETLSEVAGGVGEVTEIDLDPESEIEEIDLGNDGGIVVAPRMVGRVSATLAGFHHLHLPARTMWHDRLCVMPDVATPQQHTPEHEDQIDRWVISALRYLRSEFRAYM